MLLTWSPDGQGLSHFTDESWREMVMEEVKRVGGLGERVLGFAFKRLPGLTKKVGEETIPFGS